MTGILGTAAIRLNDNLLNRTSLPEIKAVMAHEIGQYVLNHAYKMLLAFGVILVFGLAFLKLSQGLALRRWGVRFAIRDEADPAGLPLLVALFSVYMPSSTIPARASASTPRCAGRPSTLDSTPGRQPPARASLVRRCTDRAPRAWIGRVGVHATFI